MLTTIAVGVGALSLLVSTQEGAGADGERLFGVDEFRRLDFDGDRQVTAAEMLNAAGTPRELFDINGDPGRYGLIMGALFARHPEAQGAILTPLSVNQDQISDVCWNALDAAWEDWNRERFAQWDRNGDTTVTALEYSEWRLSIYRSSFSRLDRNGDGVVTRDDYRLAAEQFAVDRDEVPARNDGPLPRHLEVCLSELPQHDATLTPSVPYMFTPEGAERSISRYDADADQQITFEEYVAFGF